MEKDAVVQELCQKGYQAYNDKGVVMIRVSSYYNGVEKSIRGVLKEMDYHCSFGIVGPKNSKKEKIDKTLEEDVNVSSDSLEESTISIYSDTEEQLTFQW